MCGSQSDMCGSQPDMCGSQSDMCGSQSDMCGSQLQGRLTVRHVWLTVRHVWLTARHVWLTARHVWLTARHVWLTVRYVWLTVRYVWLTVTWAVQAHSHSLRSPDHHFNGVEAEAERLRGRHGVGDAAALVRHLCAQQQPVAARRLGHVVNVNLEQTPTKSGQHLLPGPTAPADQQRSTALDPVQARGCSRCWRAGASQHGIRFLH